MANLPYSVGVADSGVNWRKRRNRSARIVATLQLEVAQRIDAAPGSKQYGVLGLLLGLRYESRGWFKIPSSCFFPEPEIDSACLTLVRRAEPLLPEALERIFTRIVKRGFSQRRKMIFKLLKSEMAGGTALAAASLRASIFHPKFGPSG